MRLETGDLSDDRSNILTQEIKHSATVLTITWNLTL